MLIAARVLQAAGAAALIPTSLALLLAATPAEKRSGAVRGWAADRWACRPRSVRSSADCSSRPTGAGSSWSTSRWVSRRSSSAGAYSRTRRPSPTEPLPDLLGAALLTAGIGAADRCAGRSTRAGAGARRARSACSPPHDRALGWFLARCLSHERPLVELTLFKIPSFGVATAAVFLFSLGFAAMLLSNVLWCQDVWGYSALKTGLAVAPGPAMVPALAIGAGPLVRRLGPGVVAAAGNLFFAAGLIWRVLSVETTPHYATDLLPSMLLTGIGVGLALPDPHQHHRHGAAGRPFRHRLRDRQHQPSGRLSPGRGDPRDDPRGARRQPRRRRRVFQHGWIAAGAANLAAAIVCLGCASPLRCRRSPAAPAGHRPAEPAPSSAAVGSSILSPRHGGTSRLVATTPKRPPGKRRSAKMNATFSPSWNGLEMRLGKKERPVRKCWWAALSVVAEGPSSCWIGL